MTTFLITGIGGPAGRSIATQLIERGFRVVGTDIRAVEIAGATVCIVPPATDPTFINELRDIAYLTNADVLIPTVTEELVILAKGWRHGAKPTVVMSPLVGTWIANDKYLTYQRLCEGGVAVPLTMLPSQFRTLPYSEPMSTMLLLSKPRISRGGRGVVVHEGENRDEILLLDDQSIIQEFVPGTEYAPNVYCHANGEVTVVVLEKTALAQGRVGNAVSVQRVNAPDVAAVAVATVQLLGLSGPVDIDIRRRADGTPVVLEVNARLGANSAHAPEILTALLQEVTPHYPTLFVTHEPAEQPVWMA